MSVACQIPTDKFLLSLFLESSSEQWERSGSFNVKAETQASDSQLCVTSPHKILQNTMTMREIFWRSYYVEKWTDWLFWGLPQNNHPKRWLSFKSILDDKA